MSGMKSFKMLSIVIYLTILLAGCGNRAELPGGEQSGQSVYKENVGQHVEKGVLREVIFQGIILETEQGIGYFTDVLPQAEQEVEYFTYEVREADSESYAVVTGMTEEGYAKWRSRSELEIPEELGGVPVREIGARAFTGLKFWAIILPETVEIIGEGAFQENERLYKVLFPNMACVIGEDAFAGCAEPLYFCYEGNPEEGENLVADYAERNGFLAVVNVDFTEMDKTPIVRYQEEILHLTPRVEEFFYGDSADDEHFNSMEYSEDATDFGWSEWHAPCGEFCAGSMERQFVASSTLASSDDRYSVDNLRSLSRKDVWAEGAEGSGIGEYIVYDVDTDWGVYHKDTWWMLGAADDYGYPYDGYMRYLEVCVVNGYAKNDKTWEENGRVKTLLMYVEDQPYAYLELGDTIKPQYFTLPEGDILAVGNGEIGFRFEIVDVYPGSKYEDTCLTGLALEFSGRHGH